MSFSNTYDPISPETVGSGVSNREDLTDVLTILAPEETPILSSANKEKASATFVEWTVDSLNYTGYLVNPEYYGVHELIPMGSTRLPNLGGGERGFVDCALTLGVYHPGAHGKIFS
jgi:hypothetical protein